MRGGTGVKKNHWVIMFGPKKKRFYKGLDVRNHTLGYATRTTPKRGYTTLAPTLDLTTSLRGDLTETTPSVALTRVLFAHTMGRHKRCVLLSPICTSKRQEGMKKGGKTATNTPKIPSPGSNHRKKFIFVETMSTLVGLY